MSVNSARALQWSVPEPHYRFSPLLAQLAVISLVCLAITFPNIPVTSTLSLRIDEVLVVVYAAIYGVLLLGGFVPTFRFNGMFVIGAIYMFCLSMSIWYGSAILGHPVLLRDYFELPKLWLPVAHFTLAYEAGLPEKAVNRLLNSLAVSVVLVCLYGWAQFLSLGFSSKLNAYYTGGVHHDVALEVGHRVYATMGNPNILGQLLSWMLMAYVMAFLFNVGSPFRNLGVAFFCLTTIVMTASRYALIMSLIAVVFIISLATAAIRKRAAQIALLVFVLVPLGAWAFVTVELSQRTTTERFRELSHPFEVASLEQRLNKVWLEAEYYYRLSPWLGHGPAKALFEDTWDDSEYLGNLKRYGAVGFVPYLAFYLLPLYLIWRGIRASRQRAGPIMEERAPATFMVMRAGFAMGVMALIMNVGMSTFYCELLQGFLWLWLGLAARCAKTVVEVSRPAYPQRSSAPRRSAFGSARSARSY